MSLDAAALSGTSSGELDTEFASEPPVHAAFLSYVDAVSRQGERECSGMSNSENSLGPRSEMSVTVQSRGNAPRPLWNLATRLMERRGDCRRSFNTLAHTMFGV